MSTLAEPADLTLRSEGRSGGYDVIVVGSGVGGCVTAALLAHAGRRVLVLEKNPVPGGILAARRRDGFKMDLGSHLVAHGERGPLGAVLRTLGLARPRFLRHRIPTRSRGIFPALAPERRSELPQAALAAARTLGLEGAEAWRAARLVVHMFTLSEWELRALESISLDTWIRRYSDHPGTYFLVSFLASIFFVLPPWEAAAGTAIRALRSVVRNYHLSYVEGGMDQYVHALLRRVVAAGGDVVVGARVQDLRRHDGAWTVSTAAGATYQAPAVACNVAPQELPDLLAPEHRTGAYAETLQHVKASGNAWQVKLALRRPLVDEGCIIGGLSSTGLGVRDLDFGLMRRLVADIEVGRLNDPLSLYAPVPTNFDPTLAPPGCQLILASVYGPTRADAVDPPERWRAGILRGLAQMLPGLEDALLFDEFTPIAGLGAWMGRRSCAAISNAQTPGQVGRERLPVLTPYPGLWLCGDGAGGHGVGMELAATSGMEAAAGILRGQHA